MLGTETKTLPRALVLNNVTVSEALVALADKLSDLAGEMNCIRDLSVDLDINGNRASLQFRATR